jgi:prevent-host-death family protein
MASWALQDAKARFSDVVDQARRKGPQTVTRRGQEAVVVVAVEQYRQLIRQKGQDDLVGFFSQSPLAELDPDWLSRSRDAGREVPL